MHISKKDRSPLQREHQEPEVSQREKTLSHLTPIILVIGAGVFYIAVYCIAGRWLGLNEFLNSIRPELASTLWGSIALAILIVTGFISSFIISSGKR